MSIEFTVDHNDTIANDAGIEPLIGWVTATVETRPGNFRVRDLGGATPSALKLAPRKGYLAADGHMYKDETLADPFRLVANDPAFNLRELTYRFDFDLTTPPGVPVSIPFCRGPAPSTDTTLYLARLMNDLDQPVIEVRTKGYAADILDANTVGIDLIKAGTLAEVREVVDADTYGAYEAARNGSTNDRAVLAAADTAAAAANKPLMLLAGTHLVNSDLTITSPVVFRPGAKIKPASGVTVKLNGGVVTEGLYQVFDHSAGGKCVPLKVPYYHPAWWGPTGTTDDSATWNAMLVAADSYSAWQPYQQRILVPQGDNKLWQVELADVHLTAGGRSSWISPPSAASAGDPVGANTGYVVQLKGTTTVDGVDFYAKAGVTAVFWTGSQVFLTNSRVYVPGTNAIGIWPYVAGNGSLTPKITNTMIFGPASPAASGIGIKAQSPDGELTNVTVYQCSDGLQLSRGSWTLTSVHIYSCSNNGLTGSGCNDSRFDGCYIEYNAGWGADIDGASNVTIDASTRFWANGATISGTGGLRLRGDADLCVDNRVDARFDDNTGTALYLKNADRTTGDLRITSSRVVRSALSAVCTDGVYIDSASDNTDIRVRTPEVSPVTNLVINNQSTSKTVVDYGSNVTQTATAAGTTTLTVNSTPIQEFTGTTTQTVKLPTTSVTKGQTWTVLNNSTGTVTVQASDGTTILALLSGRMAVFQTKFNTPTTSTQWNIYTTNSATSAYAPASLALRDANSNISAVNFITGKQSTATAAGTTTLGIGDYQTQVFTGTTTQTVLLPTTSITAGMHYKVVNQSTGIVTVQSSAGNTVAAVAPGSTGMFVAQVDTPTTAANWAAIHFQGTALGTPSSGTLTNCTGLPSTGIVPVSATTATAAGTTTMAVSDAPIQIWTGSTTQTVKLPTTDVVAGQTWQVINQSTGTVTVQSSGANTVLAIPAGSAAFFTALQATPTAATHWSGQFLPNAYMTTSATGGTVAQRNGNGFLSAVSFVPSAVSTATAGGTTTLTVSSGETQIFTGSTTQTVTLATTSVVLGQKFTIVNTSSGVVTVNSSGGNLVKSVAAGTSTVVTALQATPTTAAHWHAS